MPFRWRAEVDPTLNAGWMAFRILRISGDPDQYCLETLYSCNFSGGGPPLDPRMILHSFCHVRRLILFQDQFFKRLFQKYHQTVKRLDPTVKSESKVIAKVISRRQKLSLTGKRI